MRRGISGSVHQSVSPVSLSHSAAISHERGALIPCGISGFWISDSHSWSAEHAVIWNEECTPPCFSSAGAPPSGRFIVSCVQGAARRKPASQPASRGAVSGPGASRHLQAQIRALLPSFGTYACFLRQDDGWGSVAGALQAGMIRRRRWRHCLRLASGALVGRFRDPER